MCYYNTVKLNPTDFIRLGNFQKPVAELPFLIGELLNGFDYGVSPVLFKADEILDITEMEWGFLPSYIRTREQADRFRNGYKKPNGQWQQPILTLNARGEELLEENKMFREAAFSRRCLVLSTGFFEWRHVYKLSAKTGKPLKTPEKIPYHIGLKDKPYFFMAGIWQPWKDVETGEYVLTYSIVTTKANQVMSQIHNSRQRMPVILTEERAADWVTKDLSAPEIHNLATYQIPASAMEFCTVAKDFRESSHPQNAVSYDIAPINI